MRLIDEGRTVKWGKYLRGPDVYFEIMKKCADKFVPLGERVADIRRGITTGINEFFYLTDEQVEHWGIEKEFLRPVVTSTKEIPSIFVSEEKLSCKVFMCSKSKKELLGTSALKYIQWGEEQTAGESGPKWPDVPSVQGRNNWYSLAENEVSDFLVLRFRDRRHYTPVNKKNLPVGDVVFVGEFKDKKYSEFGCAFLNSVLTALFSEIYGRINLGDGLLTTYGPEILMLPLPFNNFENLSKNAIEEVIQSFRKLGKRQVLPFDEEVKRKDRQTFEKEVFKCLGLDEDDCKKVCRAVNELIEERHSLPKLRQNHKKQRVETDLGKLKEEISEEVLADGIRKFPDGFIKKSWQQVEYEEMNVPADKLKLGENFFGKQQICLENGDSFIEVSSEERGKFIVYAKNKDQFVIKVPKSETVIKKAVQEYEIYLKEIRDKLLKAFLEQCGDRVISENLTRQIFDEMDLPYFTSD